jgi:hypothetical protein
MPSAPSKLRKSLLHPIYSLWDTNYAGSSFHFSGILGGREPQQVGARSVFSKKARQKAPVEAPEGMIFLINAGHFCRGDH